MTIEQELVVRLLFGGAMEMAMPASFLDVSDVRPVPDNQEVWSDPSTDQSVVVEIVEYCASVPDSEAGPFFFRDLAEAGGAHAAELEGCRELAPQEVPGVPGASARALACGWQLLSKEREGAPAANRVAVRVAALRLPARGSDLLVTLSSGDDVSVASSAARAVAGGAGRVAAAASAGALFGAMLRSLAVKDWGLFGGGGDGVDEGVDGGVEGAGGAR